MRRVLADQHRRPLGAPVGPLFRPRMPAAPPREPSRGLPRKPRRRINSRRHPGFCPTVPRTAVRAEIFSAHAFPSACITASASRRLPDIVHAPILSLHCCTASKAAARLAASRSVTGRPVIVPSVDLRDQPATTGTPQPRPGRAAASGAGSYVPPSCRRPKPGSMVIRSFFNAGYLAG